MLAIYICDDLEELAHNFSTNIEKYLLMNDYDMKLVCTATSAQELLDILEQQENSTMGLYFLDIDLKSTHDGLWLASQIRKKDPGGFIVFITDHGDRIGDTFRCHLEAFDYIIKSCPEELNVRIRDCIISAYERYVQITSEGGKYLSVRILDQVRFLPLSSIVYISTSFIPHQLKILTGNELLSIRGDLTSISAHLNDNFFRNDKSCIVNVSHIQSIDNGQKLLKLDNGEEKAISARALMKLKKQLSTSRYKGSQ